jgi:tetratricopeptide (TPR) repeat protein
MTRRRGLCWALGGLLVVLAAGCAAEVAAPSGTPEPTTFVIITATPGPTLTPAPTPDLEGLVASSIASAQAGDPAAALESLESLQAVGATSQAQAAWTTAVSELYAAGAYEQAAELAAAGLAHFPGDTNLLFLSANTALTVGDTRAAIETFGQLIEVNPQDYRAWRLRGVAHLLEDDLPQAIADLEQAVALGEEAGVVGGGDALEAIADLGSALAVEDPQQGLLYLAEKRGFYVNNYSVLPGTLLAGQARVYTQTGQTDAALELLGRAIQRNYLEGYYYRAAVWRQIGETEKAIRDLETYLEARPAGLVSAWAQALLDELQAT